MINHTNKIKALITLTYLLSIPATYALAENIPNTLAIDNIDIAFQNNKKHITVNKNDEKIRVIARIKFSGSGLIRGYWEIDGKMHTPISQHLTAGNDITLKTPVLPTIPTYTEGIHSVRLIITYPSAKSSANAIYIVKNKTETVLKSSVTHTEHHSIVVTLNPDKSIEEINAAFNKQTVEVYEIHKLRSINKILVLGITNKNHIQTLQDNHSFEQVQPDYSYKTDTANIATLRSTPAIIEIKKQSLLLLSKVKKWTNHSKVLHIKPNS